MREPTSHAHSPAGKPEEPRRLARGKAATTAPTAGAAASAQRQAFLDVIRALAIAAARADHDAEQDRAAN